MPRRHITYQIGCREPTELEEEKIDVRTVITPYSDSDPERANKFGILRYQKEVLGSRYSVVHQYISTSGIVSPLLTKSYDSVATDHLDFWDLLHFDMLF